MQSGTAPTLNRELLLAGSMLKEWLIQAEASPDGVARIGISGIDVGPRDVTLYCVERSSAAWDSLKWAEPNPLPQGSPMPNVCYDHTVLKRAPVELLSIGDADVLMMQQSMHRPEWDQGTVDAEGTWHSTVREVTRDAAIEALLFVHGYKLLEVAGHDSALRRIDVIAYKEA